MSVEACAVATIMSQIRGARGIISIAIPEKLANAAVMALEKQISQKCECDGHYYPCPRCGNSLAGETGDWCPYCGQRYIK